MIANTSTFLENFDLKDLFESYRLAYLKQQKNKQTLDLGDFEEGRLLRTTDNSLFTFILCPEMTDQATAKQGQAVSANLQEQFLNLIAHLMAKKYAKLPSNKIKIAFGINHHNIHWTCLLAEFDGLNARTYRALYGAYQRESRLAKNREQYVNADGTSSSFTIQVNNIKNFLIEKCHIRLNKNGVLGNWELPINFRSVKLRHFDSMGKSTSYAKNVQLACQGFIKEHGATFQFENCIRQIGNTCGDWTMFNAFTQGVLAKRKVVNSNQLRAFSENITVANAHSILFAKRPRIVKANDATRICVTQEAREIADMYEKPSILSTYSFSPTWHQVSRVLLGATLGAACYMGAPAIISLGIGAKCIITGVVSILGFSCHDKLARLIYGQHKLAVGLDKKGQPIKKSVEHADGLAEWIGLSKPYLKTLGELEHDIAGMLIESEATKPKEKQILTVDPLKRQVLVRYYAKKLVTENSTDFYDTDKAIVLDSHYVDEKSAQKVLRTCAR